MTSTKRVLNVAGRSADDVLQEAAPRLPKGWSSWNEGRRQIAAAQVLLNDLGFAAGAIDGLMGPLTQIALSSWANINTVVSAWGDQKTVEERYGPAGGPNCTAGRVRLPFPMRLSWKLSETINSFSCHAEVEQSITRVYERIADVYSADEISRHGFDIFGGCYALRRMRAGSAISMHAYGIAVDHDPLRNQLKWGRPLAYLSQQVCDGFWAAWEAEGWTSLGRQFDFDWMHVQAVSV